MTAMEMKHEICSHFNPQKNCMRKTCSEIVSEARQYLRVQSTQRPFTPRDGHRHLFGRNSVRADLVSRPPSTFSLHAQCFNASNSRPDSGTRLLPLDHKPKFHVSGDAEDPIKTSSKPLTDPPDVRRGLAGARARLQVRPVATLQPFEAGKGVKEKLNPGRGQTQLSVKRLSGINHAAVYDGHPKPDPRTTASKSCKLVQPGVDSGVRATVCRPERGTDLGCGDNATNTKEDAENLLWNNVIAPVLYELESVAAGSSEGSVDRLCDLCDHLHGTLADADTLNRQCKRRSWILRTLFRLIDLNSAQLNLRIAKLCLTLCVSGNNLLNICKLIFKISRSDSNDVLFKNNSIIDSLLGLLNNEDVGVSGEALLYCVGTLKFISGNMTILRLMLDKNCIGVAQKLIQKLCTVEDTHFIIAGHILVQLTATLRNVADHPDSRPHFVSFSILPALCLVLRHHGEDQDICLNVSRIYSKLSSYSESCLSLARTHDCYPLFLELLRKHPQKQELVVRLLFTLGNLTAKSDEPRQLLFQCDGCMETLLHLYKSYQRKDAAPYTPIQRGVPPSTEPANPLISAREADDVLVKLVTVLANISIHQAVGSTLTINTTCIKLLMETLELRSVQESEELLVKVAAAINNLSFYQVEGSEIGNNQLAIATLLLKLMLSSSMDAMLEATRVYGNLSHYKDVRDFIMQSKVHRFVVTLLDSKSTEMCFSACGVLTNLALDPPNRVYLALEGASVKLVDCLTDFGPADWQLAGQACQAVWNLTGGGSEKLLDTQQREMLLEMLSAFVDEEEALKWTQNEDVRHFHKACWELEFLPAAQKLLTVLQSPDHTA